MKKRGSNDRETCQEEKKTFKNRIGRGGGRQRGGRKGR